MSKDIFSHNKILKPLCSRLTNHKYRKLVGWDESYSLNGYKYPNRHDFYYKCKICGYFFFNHTPSEEEIEYIKRRDKENEEI